jgi:pyruvate/2-oxoglutarate dehydrogenase complex dihydrolipoamide acyltransferase (E2) component
VPSAGRLLAGALTLACACTVAHGQVLYKWVDEDGKTQYSDTPPKNPKGPVTRIEPDVAPTVPPPAPKPAAAAAPKAEAPADVPDLAAQRRAKRAALDARRAEARAKVDAAKKALAEASGPEPDERQVIQQEMKKGQGGMHGLSTARSNCRTVQKDGKPAVICPAVFATDAYYERMARLEVDLRQAQ